MIEYNEPGARAPDDDSEATGSYSSPACYLHEFDTSSRSWEEVRAWRKLTRDILIKKRLALSVDVRRAKADKAKPEGGELQSGPV